MGPTIVFVGDIEDDLFEPTGVLQEMLNNAERILHPTGNCRHRDVDRKDRIDVLIGTIQLGLIQGFEEVEHSEGNLLEYLRPFTFGQQN